MGVGLPANVNSLSLVPVTLSMEASMEPWVIEKLRRERERTRPGLPVYIQPPLPGEMEPENRHREEETGVGAERGYCILEY